MIKSITISVIPHVEQRYPTVGDWQHDAETGHLQISVSNMYNWKYNVLVGIHEALEAIVCVSDGVSAADVDAFDMAYEEARQPGDESEPGNQPDAPYQSQHLYATGFEYSLAQELGVDWGAYEETICRL